MIFKDLIVLVLRDNIEIQEILKLPRGLLYSDSPTFVNVNWYSRPNVTSKVKTSRYPKALLELVMNFWRRQLRNTAKEKSGRTKVELSPKLAITLLPLEARMIYRELFYRSPLCSILCVIYEIIIGLWVYNRVMGLFLRFW